MHVDVCTTSCTASTAWVWRCSLHHRSCIKWHTISHGRYTLIRSTRQNFGMNKYDHNRCRDSFSLRCMRCHYNSHSVNSRCYPFANQMILAQWGSRRPHLGWWPKSPRAVHIHRACSRADSGCLPLSPPVIHHPPSPPVTSSGHSPPP